MEEVLPKIIRGRSKRLGRGYGSGKGGHTVGRGQKGQKSRKSLGILFEGYKVRKSLIKRLPLKRGKDKFSAKPKPLIVDLELLNVFPAGSRVDINSLISKNLVDKDDAAKFGIKILGNGKLEKKLTVELPTSKRVAKKIEKLGGKVLESQNSKVKTQKK
jgi:large subunit ribosomal protein L15